MPIFLSVDVELSNICGNLCAMCPRQEISRPAGTMTREIFSAMVKFMEGSRCLVTFSGMGDPLLHTELPCFIAMLKDRGHGTGIVVHPASLVASGGMDRLFENPPGQITVSFPSVRQEIFERLCPAISMKDALEQVRQLAQRAANRLPIRISGLTTGLNMDEADQFMHFWKDEGIPAWITPCHSRGGRLTDPALVPQIQAGYPVHAGCSLFIFHSFITWDGSVLACCHDLSAETMLGNIMESALPHRTLGHFTELIEIKVAMLRHSPWPPFPLCVRCDEPLKNVSLPVLPITGNRRSQQKFFRKLAGASGRTH